MARLFDIEVERGRFVYHYDEPAFVYEDVLAGRTYLHQPGPRPGLGRPGGPGLSVPARDRAALPGAQRLLAPASGAALDRVAGAGPGRRVRLRHRDRGAHGRNAPGVDVRDPDLPEQFLSTERALRELGRVRAVALTAGQRTIDAVTRRSGLQSRVLADLGSTPAAGNVLASPERASPVTRGDVVQHRLRPTPTPALSRGARQNSGQGSPSTAPNSASPTRRQSKALRHHGAARTRTTLWHPSHRTSGTRQSRRASTRSRYLSRSLIMMRTSSSTL